jgi:twitching motility two-component system response regulator PilG
VNVDDEESRIWCDLEQINPTGAPIIAIGAEVCGNSIAAHIKRPFHWVQILETLELVLKQQRDPVRNHAAAFSTTLLAPANLPDMPERSAPKIFKTVPAVLIVNPNPKGWRYITGELSSRGYRVDHVSTGAAAVVLLANFRYNLVFVETELPDEDGVGICKLLKQAQGRRRTTAIVLSTSRKAVDRIRGSFAGCDAFISTPIDPEELSRTLNKLVPEYVLEED